MRDRFIQALTERAKQDRSIVLVTGDLGFGVLDRFISACPKQFINAGVAEQNMTGIAAGMGLTGKKVFTYSIANFPTLRCLEQIRNDACYHSADVKVVAVGGGFSYGALGASHHATEDLAIMRSLPDITVLAPSGMWEAVEAVDVMLRTKGTCYVRLDKAHGDDSPRSGEKSLQFGKVRELHEGEHAAVFVAGGVLEEVLEARAALADIGIRIAVISVPFIKPFDTQGVVAACKKYRRVVSVEEHTLDGGLGSAIAETIADQGIHLDGFRRLGLKGVFSSVVGSQKYLRKTYGLDASSIKSAVLGLVESGRENNK